MNFLTFLSRLFSAVAHAKMALADQQSVVVQEADKQTSSTDTPLAEE